MKKHFIIALSATALMYGTMAKAQITVEEPEFINSYCILTSDSTMDVLPKENGTIQKHQTKAGKTLDNIGKVANAGRALGALGAVVGVDAGAINGALTGLKVMGTASQVSNVASSVSALASAAGMDIVFTGSSSPYVIDWQGEDLRLMIKAQSNEEDPMGIYRVVKFGEGKKDRRIQWIEFDTSVLGTPEAEKSGYVNFTGHKYGEQSYLLTIPSDQLSEGQYGVVYMSVATSTAVPVGTFSLAAPSKEESPQE